MSLPNIARRGRLTRPLIFEPGFACAAATAQVSKKNSYSNNCSTALTDLPPSPLYARVDTSDSGFPWITDDLPPVFANGNPAEIYRQSMRGLTRVGVVIIRCSMTKLRYLQVFDLIWTELPTCNV